MSKLALIISLAAINISILLAAIHLGHIADSLQIIRADLRSIAERAKP